METEKPIVGETDANGNRKHATYEEFIEALTGWKIRQVLGAQGWIFVGAQGPKQ